MLLAALLALKLVWPPHLREADNVRCVIVRTNKAEGDCQAHAARKGQASWWQFCGLIEWDGPDGDDLYAFMPISTHEKLSQAQKQCGRFMEAYEKEVRTK
jgi:hypothetical protein